MERSTRGIEPFPDSGPGALQLLDRAMAVLRACEERPASLAELVVRTGLARATAHRLASALEGHGLLRRDGDARDRDAHDRDVRWALGPTLARLGALAVAGPSLAVTALPALEALRDATGESVQLYVRQGAQRLCVVALESPHSLRTIVAVGAVLPLAQGSAGRVLSGEEVSARGWLASVEEREPGVASVSAPVMGPSGIAASSLAGSSRRGMSGAADAAGGMAGAAGGTMILAAVSVSGPVERTTRDPGGRYGPLVVRAAAAIEHAAGFARHPLMPAGL